jgi:subfamily B ATP-binding cassette protein MsbA
VAKESFEAPRLVKVYNAERHVYQQFDAVNDHNLRSNMRLVLTRGVSNPTVQLVTSFGLAFVLWIAIADAIHGRMSMGDLLGFFAALVSIAQPLRELVGVAGPLQQGIAAGQSLFELLDEPVEPQGGALTILRARGEVQFDHVSLRYGADSATGEPHTRRAAALVEVSLQVAAGESLAIVGRSGSGKSTLVNLLPRFYDATTGSVSIDGVDVRKYRVRSLREKISIVLQDPVLFQGTIADNLRYGRLDATAEEIEQAARAAHAHEFIARLPKGYDTEIAEAGGGLSGGERQRLSVARAILKNAPILVLDEPTSSLDAISEEIVFAALRRLRTGRTTIVIAHRLSTVRDADRILVLDGGEIAAQGRHEELLKSSQLYRRMCARLSVGKSLDEPESVDELIEAAKR